MNHILNMPGQISMNTSLGRIIYDLVINNPFKNIVDIGTWNGMGTTMCVMEGLKNKYDINTNVYTIELYPEMIATAKTNLKNYIKKYNLHILEGTIIDIDDVYSWFDHSSLDFINDGHAKLWYHKDMELLKNAKNISELLPKTIDLLILDGGEYSTYPEWQRLKEITHFFVLDDTNLLKCKKIKEEIMEDTDKYTIIHNVINERNGFLVGFRNV
jgi:hypothetical protein